VLYRLPFLLAEPEAVVWLVEGEKDADRVAAEGFCATTNVCGASAWRDEYTQALRGRRVVILPDNDEPGEKRARQLERDLRGVCTAVVLRLPGLPDKGDVSDWLDAGNGAMKLKQLADDLFRGVQAFDVASSRLAGEREDRIECGARALSFGVQFLDDAMGGILPRDLVLIGAKTGLGKTALATMIAQSACDAGKNVHYFALEAEDKEIERRMKFQILSTMYYERQYRPKRIRYLDWYMGRLDEELASFEPVADMEMRRVARTLSTFYRLDSFTGADFVKQLDAIKDTTDLVILDHLHYVDSADDNENRGYKNTVKQIRDAALRSGKPVIVVAHVRKTDRKNETLVPTIEDFHGSSDIPKIATKAIMLAPAYDVPPPEPHLWPTYMQIPKCRLDSSLARFVSLVTFNARTNSYEKQYALGRATDGGKTFTGIQSKDVPPWSTGFPQREEYEEMRNSR